ncbi:Succinate dehydrogenase/Fumarate reductase transmembrane subunit [Roseivivax jejudonensis]|uniref:Succinate dehydrogenase hydrophobic membrane anchor subunit n=1 Tax=Roseivivax jejudonensis TaxID=1529041 RepID=A0A1X6ZRT5_9RHOB|nr:succinate dehydrogenase, hydrophobic membrane anchor protein [Roseivivax jejudonensis]SLN59552.1 Succinate dehydrogenase/Fumarate reductase transmembrane subunit [Roseivivax jejudonensis]
MSYMTDRKRADPWGSAKTGTQHHWRVKVQSVALLVLIPLFLIAVAPAIGKDYAGVTDHFARPFPAIVAALALTVSFVHFADGFQTLIEDYVHNDWAKFIIIGMTCLCWGAAAVTIFAVARLAL